MNKVQITKMIAKLYFIGALAGSFTHLITAAHKGGLSGWEAYSVPFMIDGLAVMGMIMRSEEYSTHTRKIGFRVQIIMGMLSLAGNVFAAHNTGGMVYGFGIVALFLFAEWLSDNITSAVNEAEVQAKAEAEAKKAAAIAKGQATRKANKALAEKVVKNAEKVTRAAAKR